MRGSDGWLGLFARHHLHRSVIVNMRRRAPNETVEPFQRRLALEAGEELRRRLELWASTILDQVRDQFPEMPEGIADRNADVWEALLSVADAAGGQWPTCSRVAAVALVGASRRGEGSLGIRLLTDIRTVFGERESLRTKDLLNGLINMDESVWADSYKGKPMTDRGLAMRLRCYEISSKDIRWGELVCKGYDKADFLDAWERYLPRPPRQQPPEGATSATSATTEHYFDEHVREMTRHYEQAEAEAAKWAA